jgi:hypothetical protein
LTQGDDDIHQTVTIFGTRTAANRLIDELRPVLDLDRDELLQLVEPMFSHVAIEQSGQRVTCAGFERWGEAGLLERHGIRAEMLATSYATLAAHRDPTFEEVLAEAKLREDCPREVDRDGYRMTLRFDDR